MLRIRPDTVLPKGKSVQLTHDGKVYVAQSLGALVDLLRGKLSIDEVVRRAKLVIDESGKTRTEPVRIVSVSQAAVYTTTALLLRRVRAGGVKTALVEQEEAERRAGICASCSLNVYVPCLSCLGLHVISGGLFAGKATSKDKLLLSCAVCRCKNQYQIWCAANILREIAERTEMGAELYPEYCWKAEILK